MDSTWRLCGSTLSSHLKGRQCYFHFTGPESEVEEVWLGSTWHHAGYKDSMRQEMYPGSSGRQLPPLSPSHFLLPSILFFFKKLGSLFEV